VSGLGRDHCESTGMSWYTPDGWRRLRAIADDVVMSYPEFVRKTERLTREFEARGIAVDKHTIDVDHMVEWCRRHGHAVDGRGRMLYGTVLASHGGKLFDLDTPIVDPTRVVQ
jgi:hypothetical protein